MSEQNRSLTCPKSSDISELTTKMNAIYPVIMGDGSNTSPGLHVTVAVLAKNVSNLTGTVNALTASVSNLVEVHAKEDAARIERERMQEGVMVNREKRYKNRTLLISVIMVILTLVTVVTIFTN